MYRFSRAMKPLASHGSRALHMSSRLPLRQHQKNVATFHTMSTHLAAAKSQPEPNDVFMQGNSGAYIEEMYESWLKDPSSVHLSWQIYFKNMANGVSPGQAYQPPPTIVPSASARLPSLPGAQLATGSSSEVIDHMKIQLLVRAYQVRGHHIANLDPLGIQHVDLDASTPKELELSYYGFTEKDMDRKFTLGPGILPAFIDGSKEMTLREIVQSLQKIYCRCFMIIVILTELVFINDLFFFNRRFHWY
jgi:2-oxoglutarate dehydrogenase E1 component